MNKEPIPRDTFRSKCGPPTSTALILLEIAPQISTGNHTSPLKLVYQVEAFLPPDGVVWKEKSVSTTAFGYHEARAWRYLQGDPNIMNGRTERKNQAFGDTAMSPGSRHAGG